MSSVPSNLDSPSKPLPPELAEEERVLAEFRRRVKVSEPRDFEWTPERYLKAAELGILPERGVELYDGRIVLMPPMGIRHIVALSKSQDFLREHVNHPKGYLVLTQCTVRMGGFMPDPDLIIYHGGREMLHRQDHPASKFALVLEISDSTLANDRGRKASQYAKYGIEDYWIANLTERVVEIHREPMRDGAGGRYAKIDRFTADQQVSLLALPEKTFAAGELLDDLEDDEVEQSNQM